MAVAQNKSGQGDFLSVLTSKKALAQAVSGAAAQVVATLILFPLDSIKIMVQLDHSLSAIGILREHIREGKCGRLYHGISSKLVQSPQQKFQYFYMQTLLKTLYIRYTNASTIPVRDSLALGFLAALQGLATTLPLDVVTNRMISRAKNKSAGGKEKAPSMLETFLGIWEHEGFVSFYRSLNASIILCINPAITYVVFDKVKAWVLNKKKGNVQYLTTFEAFAAGAFSKAVAATITFPAVRAKTRMTSSEKIHNSEEPAPGMIRILKDIVHERGIGALYTGIGPQIWKGVLQEALMLAVKERIAQVVTSMILGSEK